MSILHVTGAGAKALAWLGEKFNVLKDDAVSSYQAIADALAAGNRRPFGLFSPVREGTIIPVPPDGG